MSLLLLAASLAAPLLGAAAAAPAPQGKIVLVALSGPEEVPIYVCETALANAGIDDVVSEAQRVPQGAAKIAELVSEGFGPMQY